MTFLILPSGMSLSVLGDRLAITMVPDWAVQYRRVYGYLGEIKLLPACVTHRRIILFSWVTLFSADDECGTETPALFQVVLQLPFPYGSTKCERYDSWLRCRVSAFTSASCFGCLMGAFFSDFRLTHFLLIRLSSF